jgi:putative nucleotidyltransferase with HDIG domain
MIANDLGVNNKQVELIRKAALLHDVGKLGISERILAKPARLTAGEYNLMKTHPQMGADILEKSSSLIPLIPIVKHHHEHFDGSGYPAGLSGNAIPIEARIVAVADAIEAMASDRPYRKALSHEMIKAELIRNSGTQFDPQMVAIALRLLEPADQSVVVNIGLQNLLQDSPPVVIRKLAGD